MYNQEIFLFAHRSRLELLGCRVLLIFALFFIVVGDASALTIIRDFIGGTPQANVVGNGNLVDIFNEAADQWEASILDPHIITLHFGWAPVGGGTHSLNSQGGTPNRETEGTILFNNDTLSGHFQWFLDPTPGLNEEYLSYREDFDDLGGGRINTGRVYSHAVGDAADARYTDLLSAALHEIGHAFGMSAANTRFIAESTDGDIDITTPGFFQGTTIPLALNNFGVTSHFHPFINGRPAMSSQSGGERNLLSALDILAMAELSQFNHVNLDPYITPVPEPSSILFIMSGLAGIWMHQKFKAKSDCTRSKPGL